MSDFYKTIVPLNVKSHQSKELANKLISYLQQHKIIEKEVSGTIFGRSGYKVGMNYRDIVQDNSNCDIKSIDGLEVIVGRRTVFDNGGNGLEQVNCPKCNFNTIATNWTDALQDWFNGGDGTIQCENCKEHTSIIEYDFQPKWGFGELGFIFYNWPKFKDVFIKQIEEVLDKEVLVIRGLI
ncbi:hypothetical protein [uncultured Aquimarina sp.]|uniref:hypothetical protein n=1 Tax=uncultured Aquimarina sp. TaxID=575652 RepID=UPI00260AD98F|nr:hypothetical protein [uncultured Aquimarina sp.]